jgi:hypothetical protein
MERLQIYKSKQSTCQQPYNNVAKANWRQQEWEAYLWVFSVNRVIGHYTSRQ